MRKFHVILFFLLCFFTPVLSQTIASSVIAGGQDYLPFWFEHNNGGISHAENLFFTLYTDFEHSLYLNKALSLGFRSENTVLFSSEPDIFPLQLYTELLYEDLLFLFLGRRQMQVGSVVSGVSSGCMVLSNNALPPLRIALGLNRYVSVPYSKGILMLKGHFTHGWFDNQDNYVQNILLHEKSLLMRVNLPRDVFITAGIIHEAMWGGDDGDRLSDFQISWNNYFRVLRADSGGEDSPETFQINRIGNHLGVWDFSFGFSFLRGDTLLYYQHFFEDRSGMNWQNRFDGLWGLHWQTEEHLFKELVFEWLYTVHQSGPLHDIDGVVLGGRDSYYNHGVYRNGWTNRGKVLGNPLILTTGEGKDLRIAANRIIAWHAGGVFEFNGLSAEVMGTFAEYVLPSYSAGRISEKGEGSLFQFFSYAKLDYPVSLLGLNSSVSLAVGFDRGQIYNSFGSSVSLHVSF